jgi:hypothetical protein
LRHYSEVAALRVEKIRTMAREEADEAGRGS